jgi:hypothetical protein
VVVLMGDGGEEGTTILVGTEASPLGRRLAFG